MILGEGDSLLAMRKGSTTGDSIGLEDEFKKSSSSLAGGFMVRYRVWLSKDGGSFDREME